MKWIRDLLCKWLGIWDLEYKLESLAVKHGALRLAHGELKEKLEQHIRVTDEAIRKAIAGKFDPRSPFDPERIKESDEIGRRVLQGFYAEEKARHQTGGKP